MQRMFSAVIAGLSCAALPGCATAPAEHMVVNSRLYDASFDTIWGHLIQFFTAHNIQVKTIEKASGVIYAERLFVEPDRSVDCGKAGIFAIKDTSGSFNVFVVPENGKTKVTVNVTYSQTRAFGEDRTTIKCASTGILENDLLNAL